MKEQDTIVKVKITSNGELVRVLDDGKFVPYEGKRMSEADWERVRNFTEEEIVAAANSDIDNPIMNREDLNNLRPIFPDVKNIRKKLGMTQQQFADSFLLSIASVRDWEQGRSNPDNAARSLLIIVDRLPKQSMKALGTEALRN